jgi:porphobilinogen synthase
LLTEFNVWGPKRLLLFPDYRLRRLRRHDAFRRMIRETRLSVDDLILPLFVIGGKGIKNPIPSMPGHDQFSIDNLLITVEKVVEYSDKTLCYC